MTFLPSSLRSPSALPGFGLALGFTLAALSLIVLIPLAALVLRAASIGPADFFAIARDPRVLAALRLSFGTALIAALINTVFGLLIAWVLVRYRFPGRRIIDAAVDLPFALPTAVAGISMAAIYAPNGPIGSIAQQLGFKIAYTPLGIVLPHVYPALLTGFALAFARGVGEYGSVIFIAGNIPMVSEIAPLLIVIKLEEFDYGGATVIATLMLAISFAMLFLINAIQGWSRTKYGNV